MRQDDEITRDAKGVRCSCGEFTNRSANFEKNVSWERIIFQIFVFNRYIYISVLFYSSMVVVRDVIVRFILLSALLLLFSCSSSEGVGDDLVDSVNVEDGGEGKDDSGIVPTINVTASAKVELQNTICVSEWICLSAKSKIYREGNCSFTKREDCKFGCKNNTCAPAPVCTAGWNCDGNYYRGYRLESCE